jgi:site-specific recombinase
MEQSQVTAITVEQAKPRTVNHENSKLYAMLKQCMLNNEELRQALLEAAETIEILTQKLMEKNES